jgi:hypothetical protein
LAPSGSADLSIAIRASFRGRRAGFDVGEAGADQVIEDPKFRRMSAEPAGTRLDATL